ncbi:MAG: PQQ-binding-like beta-propeller repeat protein [Anaerolineales bacterium]|nr:PQQ-binding-like beta-propeller repeat protein [Anaerolineales bacterium]
MKKILLLLLLLALVSCNTIREDLAIEHNEFPLIEHWSQQFDSRIYHVAVSGDLIVVGRNRYLTALDMKTGQIIWEKRFLLDTDSHLLFSGDYLIASDKSLIRIINKAGEEVSSIKLDSSGTRAQILDVHSNFIFVRRIPTWTIEVYNFNSGAMLWRVATGRGGINIAYDDSMDLVFITSTSSISAHNISDGDLLWKVINVAKISTYDTGIIYYYTNGTVDFSGGKISAIALDERNHIWVYRIIGPAETSIYNLTVFDSKLIANMDYGLLAIDKSNGSEIWRSESREFFLVKPVNINNVIYARSMSPGRIHAISPEDGRTIGFLQLGNPSITDLSQERYDVVYASEEFLIFPFENILFVYKEK